MGRKKLDPAEKLKQVPVYIKPRYEEQIKKAADNLNKYGTIEPPKQ